jgi:hypothetical protein
LTAQTPAGPYPGIVGAGALALTFAPADVANGNAFPLSGHELLVAWNSGASAYTVTLTSTPDSRGRTSDITAYSIAAGGFAVFSYVAGTEGWIQSDGNAYVSASNAAIQFAVIRAPR